MQTNDTHESPGRAAGQPPRFVATGDVGGYYRLLVETVRDYALFVLDPWGRVMTWNVGAEQLKGYQAHEIIGRHFSTFYQAADIAAGKPDLELEIALRDGRVEDEGWRVRNDGSLFWASVVITALHDANGKHVGFAKVTRDVTERRRAEDELRQSEERFRVLVQGVRDYAIFMLTPDGRIASWNEGAERLKQYRPDEIIGRHFSVFYPAAEIAAGKPAWELEVAVRDGKFEEEGWRLRKDGSLFWANVVITALYAHTGALLGFAKVTRDLTERRAAIERTVADARRLAEVEAASRTKTEFLNALSHELRTPINATIGYIELLTIGIGGQVTEQQRDYLKRIRGSQEHLLRIITDLLNYGRIEAGHIHYDMGPLRMHDLVEAVLPMIVPQAVTKNLRIAHGPCSPDVIGLGDRGKAEQIVLNLLSNAVKFTPAGGSITISCGTVDGAACVTVADSGPGIPADRQREIFEPFVQLGRSLVSGHEGTGLGLAISRDLAHAMGGDVSVESRPGSGAAFTLSLRVA